MSLQSFFNCNAEDFSNGDLEAAADTLSVPAVIYVGRRQINVPDRATLIETLRTYRANLLVESYVETRCTVHHSTDCGNGKYQAFVTWCNLNDKGAEISRFDATYILCDAGEGRLQCVTAEILPPVKERLLTGLALV